MMPVATDVDARARRSCGAATWPPRSSRPTAATCCPGTNSPALAEMAEYVAVAVREALLADPQPDAVVRYSELAPYDTEVIEVCLAALGDHAAPGHPAPQGTAGRRARVNRTPGS